MKIKIIIPICLLLTNIAAQATDSLLQGRWTVMQVTIEKNIDGKIQTTVYNTAVDVQSHIPCLQELEINVQNIVLHYPNGREETTEYTFEDDQLTIYGAMEKQTYRYDIKDGNLTLTANYDYVNNNLPAKQTEYITEKRIITLKNENK